MSLTGKSAVLAFGALLALGALANAQSTVTYTNRRGDTVTHTRSLQNGQYTNDKTITGPNGKTYTKDRTSYVNGNACDHPGHANRPQRKIGSQHHQARSLRQYHEGDRPQRRHKSLSETKVGARMTHDMTWI